MGTWGTDLYADDTACDVRDGYIAALQAGVSGQEAADRALAPYRPLLSHRQVACCAYFALADTAWHHGQLTDEVKGTTNRVIVDWRATPRGAELKPAIVVKDNKGKPIKPTINSKIQRRIRVLPLQLHCQWHHRHPALMHGEYHLHVVQSVFVRCARNQKYPASLAQY